MSVDIKQPKLEIRNLGKDYGISVAVEPSSLSIAAGEFVTLLGPSGSGKTTLLQMISGLIEPSSGQVLIDGKECTVTPVHKRDIGMVFQSYALFPHMSVAENIAFPLKMRGWQSSAIPRAVERALEMVRMSHLRTRRPRELSGGQQQRIALARCLVYEPSIILMDEPLGALDKNLREHMQVEIMRLHRELKATIVYVTHDQEEALAMSDRVCLMSNARIEQVDSPRDIYLRPRNIFVAKFIGESNILSGIVESNGRGGFNLNVGGLSIPLDGVCEAGKHVHLAIRPEHLQLTSEPMNATVRGVVRERIFAGAQIKVLFELPDGTLMTARLGNEQSLPEAGAEVGANWLVERAVLLDSASAATANNPSQKLLREIE